MSLPVNDGSRPSRLELDARAAGERPGPLPPAHAAELAAARAAMPPLDMTILRARAHRLSDSAPTPTPPPRRRWTWLWLSPLVLAAAAALLVVGLPRDGERTRGGANEAYLETFVLQDGVGRPWEPGTRLREGDRVQFAYNAQDQGDTLVLLSVDGEGTLSVFWPATGDVAEPVEPLGTHLLTASVELDDAAGPEVFVAVFGVETVAEVASSVAAAQGAGGLDGVVALGDAPSVVVVVVDKE